MALPIPNWQTWLKAALAVAVTAGLVYFIDLDRILAAAAGADPWWIAAAGVLLPANLWLETLLWHRLVRGVNPAVTFRQSASALLAGHTFGFFTPARIGEFAGRPLYTPHSDKWTLGLMVVAHRLFDIIAVVATGAAALLVFDTQIQPTYRGTWLGLAATGGAVTILLLLLTLLPGRTYRMLSRVPWLQRRLAHLSFLRTITTRNALGFLALAYLRYAVYASQFVLLIRAFAPDTAFTWSYLGVALVLFAKFAIPPFTLADIGIREGASVFVFGFLNVDAASAFNASILIFGINLMLPACLGLPFVLYGRIRGKESAASTAAGMDPIHPTVLPAEAALQQSPR